MGAEIRIGNELTGLLLKEAPLEDTTGLLKALVFDPTTGEVKYYGILPNISNVEGTYDLQNLDKTYILQLNGNNYIIGQLEGESFKGIEFLGSAYSYNGDYVQISSEIAIISPPNFVVAHTILAIGGAELKIRTDGIIDLSGSIKNSLANLSGSASIDYKNSYYICEIPGTSITLPTFPAEEINKFIGATFKIMNRSGGAIDLIPSSPITKIEGVAANYSIPDNTNVEVILTGSTNGWRISSKTTI